MKKVAKKLWPRTLTRRYTAWALLVSVAFHGVLFFTSWPPSAPMPHFVELVPAPASPSIPQFPVAPQPEEFELPRTGKQIVQTEGSGENSIPEESFLLSNRNQKVARQTRAAQTGDFRARSDGGGRGGRPSLSPEIAAAVLGESGESGPKPSVGSSNGGKPSLSDLGVGGLDETPGGFLAATDDGLEGIPFGNRTVLNTREFRYYGFYERLKKELRLTWKPEVHRRSAALIAAKRFPAKSELKTRIIVTLDAEGKVLEVQYVRRSGSPTIDGAAQWAFEKIGQFPNPPRGMIDRDGVARLHWEFVVETSTMAPLVIAQDVVRNDITDRANL